MWRIESIENLTTPKGQTWVSDGRPINARRGPTGNSYTLWCSNYGYLTINDIGKQDGGPQGWALDIEGQTYWYNGEGALNFTFRSDRTFSVIGNENQIDGHMIPSPVVSNKNLDLFKEMMEQKLIPYQKVPDDPGKTSHELKELGKQFFPKTACSFELAMAIYDWTTACFFRIDLFTDFVYSKLEGLPIDQDSIANLIWSANWLPYTAHNQYFMMSLMMEPADSLERVQVQLEEQASKLIEYNRAEEEIISQAVMNLPRVLVAEKPILYHGGPDISMMTKDQFCAQFQELPANKGPVGTKLQIDFEEALETILRPGNIITKKGFWVFTDSMKGAIHSSNKIIVKVLPPQNSEYWPAAAEITPLSDSPEKTEYLFVPGTSFTVYSHDWIEGDGENKKLFLLTLILQDKPI
jgi:hypothetical protein